jgi:pimeloyl-ACP methyl ester carboxylesterase
MDNLRIYGNPPYKVAVIHGGPGAAGEMAPVARELSSRFGILEPLQTAKSVEGQVDELAEVLKAYTNGPATLIGHSWGAWLIYILAAKHPELVKKLILVGSGAFEAKYVAHLHETRMSRLTTSEQTEIQSLLKLIENPQTTPADRNAAFARFGSLFSKTDTYAPLPDQGDPVNCQADIYNSVWPQAAELRKTGKLLELGKSILCPVLAIHGDYDPTPSVGIKKPLLHVLKNFNFIELKKCGHSPWMEQYARDIFYEIITSKLIDE